MHSYCSNDAVTVLNAVKSLKIRSKIKNLKFTRILSASQPASLLQDPVLLVLRLQNFYTTKVIVSDLQNCCSEERLSTVPWCFVLSFIS